MLRDKTVWIVFFALTVLVTACSEPASTSNKMYDASEIREALHDLDQDDPKAEEILYGKEIFDKTNVVLPDHVGNELSCMSCHGDGGLAQNSPMVGVTAKYPKMHHDKHTTIEDRINGCFQRSMNGEKLGTDSEEMDAMVAYFEFISKDFKDKEDISWRMKNEMKEVPEPDVTNGSELFVEKNCISCHATDGSGTGFSTGPALWGEGSFNEAAGMTRLSKTAGFIQNNMPKGQGGTLTDQEAADLAAFLLSHDRPIPDTDVVGDYHKDPDRDYMTEERRKKVRNNTFDWSELDSVVPND